MGVFDKLSNLFNTSSVTSSKEIDNKHHKEDAKEYADPLILGALSTLDKHSKKAFLPELLSRDFTLDAKSKISGLGYITKDYPIPVSEKYGKPMQLMLQLNSDELTASTQIDIELNFEGLLQLYYYQDEVLCRVIPKSELIITKTEQFQDSQHTNTEVLEGLEGLEELVITQWSSSNDYPHRADFEDLGIDIPMSRELDRVMRSEKKGRPISTHKLKGYGAWCQDAVHLEGYELLFQIADCPELSFNFGEDGMGYVFIAKPQKITDVQNINKQNANAVIFVHQSI